MNKHILAGISIVFTLDAVATPPSEMASLSLQELLSMSTKEDTDNQENSNWTFGITYTGREYEGYNRGSNKLSNQQVQFIPGQTARTNQNYPILPTEIIQQASIFSLTYEFSPGCHLAVDLPFIKQSTDHISVVPGYDHFNITTQGLGDIGVSFRDLLFKQSHHSLQYSIGLSLPTGSIDEKGDTPRAAGDQQLPYTMQLGSGTWDIPWGFYYQNNQSSWSWGVNLHGKWRTNNNDRHYRLGHHSSLSFWAQAELHHKFQPLVRLTMEQAGSIRGRDDEITVPGAYPYPANITAPNNYGGKKVKLGLGTNIHLSDNHHLLAEFSVPLYQHLNGIQIRERANLNLQWKVNL